MSILCSSGKIVVASEIPSTLCSGCKRRQAEPPYKTCRQCLEKSRKRYAKHMAAGTCNACGRAVAEGYITCQKCLTRLANKRRADFEAAIEAYGGPTCVGCGETEKLFLTFDHINNDGRADRAGLGVVGSGYVWKMRKLGFPPGLQILCFGCNLAKARNRGVLPTADTRFICGCCGKCPCEHGLSADVRRNRRLILEALGHYGGQSCACCGETNLFRLTLDHVDGYGFEHRREIAGDRRRGGRDLYVWLRKNNYPQEPKLRVMCTNCNCGRDRNGGICPHKTHKDPICL